MNKNTFVLIDGNAILHRAYHAMPRFEINGKLVNAIYGFISILFSAIERYQPEYLAVAFDVKGPTFRDELFKEYKAKRVKPPQEFYDQIPDVWEFLKTAEIPLLTREGYEADDIIGTLAKRVHPVKSAEGGAKQFDGVNGDLGDGEVIIITGDQDTLQLVDSHTKVAMPAMGKIKETLYDRSAVSGKLGISPEQVIDYKALSGDSSDNIPGVRGIGPKTATELIKEFGSVEGVYEYLTQKLNSPLTSFPSRKHSTSTSGIQKKDPRSGLHPVEDDRRGGEKLKIKDRIAKLLLENKDAAFLSKKLATIKTDVEFSFKLSEAKTHDFDEEKLRAFLEKYRFRSLVKRMPSSKRAKDSQQQLF